MLFAIQSLAFRIANARRPGEPLPAFAVRLFHTYQRIRSAGRSKIQREDVRAVSRLLRSGRIAFGPQVRAFEREFAADYGAAGAAACSSGTAAVHVALAMARLEPGDEVIVPPITDMGSILPILASNAIPIFADVEPDTWNLDPDAVEAQLTSRTRAIIAVHLFGNPCRLDRLRALADRNGLHLIEDCAQAHGARWQGKPVGTIGDAGSFSLQWTKHITCGEGGITISRDPELAERGRLFVDKGWNRGGGAGARQYPIFGLNYRLSEMQAALARVQRGRVPAMVERRNENARIVREALAGTPGIRFQETPAGAQHAYWQLAATVDAEAPFTADALALALGREKIQAGAHYIGKPIHLCHEPLLERRVFGSSDLPFSLSERAADLDYAQMATPVAADVLDRLVMLPAPSEHLTISQTRKLAAGIRETVDRLCDPARMQTKPRARYRLGMIGCGAIARQHLEAYAKDPGVRASSIADVSEGAVKTVGSAFGVEARYLDYQEMLGKEELDIVVVALWPTLHERAVNAALRSGVRAVLCEKPIASNLAEARSMLETARDVGTLLVIGHQHRFNPHLELARELLAKGEIGAVQSVEAHCAGSLINNGSHVVDGLLYMLGDPTVESVKGALQLERGLENRGQPVEAGSHAELRLAGGVSADMRMGEGAEQTIGWHFRGERGSMHVDMEAVRVEAGGRPRTLRRARVRSMQDQMEEILSCLENPGRSHRGDARFGYASMEVLMGILESARLEKAISMPVSQMEYPLDTSAATTPGVGAG